MQISQVFLFMPFFIESNPWYPLQFAFMTLYSRLMCDVFLVFPCFSWPCQFWKVLVSYFLQYPSIWVCLSLFVWVYKLKLCLSWVCDDSTETMDFGEDVWHKRQVPSLLYQTGGIWSQYELIMVILILNTWLMWYLPSFSTEKKIFFSCQKLFVTSEIQSTPKRSELNFIFRGMVTEQLVDIH